ncbi:Propeptide PepSY amd peptidase M4 [Neobacillus bataviensis LMG 21833]|uniref:Propeptide PepSY amd peptidase M4 n=1 Tax=Neobacillus bataviensis LMG 21833 TaxID=1117379 RepID=K6C6D6_9BACI|nr:PepSY domain-containing protein [Neobacillus bataviensis]EKN66695.1 Propeptide PepSY amd peptidase M4 [Neobacillus bataviensis LMG 21833]
MKKLILLLTLVIPLGFGVYFQGGHAKAAHLLLTQNTPISEKQAKEIALGKVKGEVVKVKLEEDDGRQYYEVIIKKSGSIYEVEIDAKTGKVVEVEHEGSRDGHGDNHDDDDHDDGHGDDHDDD